MLTNHNTGNIRFMHFSEFFVVQSVSLQSWKTSNLTEKFESESLVQLGINFVREAEGCWWEQKA